MSTKEYTSALGYDWLSVWYDLAIKLTVPERTFRNFLPFLIIQASIICLVSSNRKQALVCPSTKPCFNRIGNRLTKLCTSNP